MNISGKGDYALRAMFDLASQPVGQPVKIAEIARRQAIPQKFLELILAGLKQGGFVESRRGADGGYLLARQPEFLTVGKFCVSSKDEATTVSQERAFRPSFCSALGAGGRCRR